MFVIEAVGKQWGEVSYSFWAIISDYKEKFGDDHYWSGYKAHLLLKDKLHKKINTSNF